MQEVSPVCTPLKPGISLSLQNKALARTLLGGMIVAQHHDSVINLCAECTNLRPKAAVLALVPSCISMSHERTCVPEPQNVKLSLESFPGTTAY